METRSIRDHQTRRAGVAVVADRAVVVGEEGIVDEVSAARSRQRPDGWPSSPRGSRTRPGRSRRRGCWANPRPRPRNCRARRCHSRTSATDRCRPGSVEALSSGMASRAVRISIRAQAARSGSPWPPRARIQLERARRRRRRARRARLGATCRSGPPRCRNRGRLDAERSQQQRRIGFATSRPRVPPRAACRPDR